MKIFEKIKRREFLRKVSLGTAALILPKLASSQISRPNVIFVLTDDQGYGDLGCHGNEIIKTPNLDRLHHQSMRLTNFHVSPTCAPTRASLMTGRYNNRTGVWHTIMGRSLLREDEVTIADVLKNNGYKTGIFGKWHLGDNYPFRPQDRGFDEVLIHGGGGIGQTPDFWDNDYFDDTYLYNSKYKKFKGYCTDIWFDNAIKFIETNKNHPFFCYISTNAPHGPFHVAEKYSQPYKDAGLSEKRARFYGMIANIDENMGRLDQKLETLELKENTIFVYLTDNGTSIGVNVDKDGWVRGKGYNARMRGHKNWPYEGGHRVPCFIRWPQGGIAGGKDIKKLTAHFDLMPTVMDLCGITKPNNLKFDGTSLTPLLQTKAKAWSERVLVVDSQRIENPQKWRKSVVMNEHWRMINGRELYDMTDDPGQLRDISGSHPATVQNLREAYEKWWVDISKRFSEYCYIVLGTAQENPATLTGHDWHTEEKQPWHQRQIRNALKANGFWAVSVAEKGEYEISLRRWPTELRIPITAGVLGKKKTPRVTAVGKGKALQIVSARLKIANVDETETVAKDTESVSFRVLLDTGKTKLQTWFTDDKGESFGAYYVQVRRIM